MSDIRRYTIFEQSAFVLPPNSPNGDSWMIAPDGINPLIIERVYLGGYNPLAIFSGNDLELMVYFGYTSPFTAYLPGSVGFLPIAVARGTSPLTIVINTPIIIPSNRRLWLWYRNNHASQNYHVWYVIYGGQL